MDFTKSQKKVNELKKELKVPFYYGAGYPIKEPHAVVTYMDALNREGSGFIVYYYPEGATNPINKVKIYKLFN